MQYNQRTSKRDDKAGNLPLRVLAAAAFCATWTVQPADSPDIKYEAFEHLFHANREVVDWLIERIKEKYGCVEVCNAQVERELDKLSHQILLDHAYEAVWLTGPVDVQGIAEHYGIDRQTIETHVEEVMRTKPRGRITNGDILLLIARVKADQVSFPEKGGSAICTVKTDPAYLQYLEQRLREPAFLAAQDIDAQAIAHYYEMAEWEVRQVASFLSLRNGEHPTNGRIIAAIDQAHGDWALLGLLPNTNELLSASEATRLGILAPYILCACGERMYKGDGINTRFGSYCSEECVHRYVCMGYALAEFVIDEGTANPSHPIDRWICAHKAVPGQE